MQAFTSIPAALQRGQVSPLVAELSAAFEIIDDEPLLAALSAYRWTGRPGWSVRALWRSYLASFVLNHGTTNDLIRRLQDDAELRDLCGFDALPSRWTFNRFVSRLSHHAELVEQAIGSLADRLHSALPDFGKGVAIDASVVRSWSRPDRKPAPSDPEASWTAKGYGRKEWYWGYKLHLSVDAKYELPISAIVTTASRHDSMELLELVAVGKQRHAWFSPEYVTADAGYDSLAIADGLTRVIKTVPIIAIRKTKDRKHAPRPDDPRHFPPIPRDTPEWKALYSTRQSVERAFSRLKQHRALDSHCRRGLRKVRLHALMSVLTMQVTAASRLAAGEIGRMREVSRRLR